MPDKFNEYDPLDIELKQLFERNKEWAAQMVEDDPAYFSRLVTQQLPKYFWIGCSDSRVPSTQITNLRSSKCGQCRVIYRSLLSLRYAICSGCRQGSPYYGDRPL